MKGKYNTNNGEVNVVEYDPSSKKARIEGGGWVSESQHKNWTSVEEIKAVNEVGEDALVIPETIVEVVSDSVELKVKEAEEMPSTETEVKETPKKKGRKKKE